MPANGNSEKSPRPRVLHAIFSLGRGGAETQLSYLAVGLAHIGWDVHVALLGETPGSEINEARVKAAGVTVHRLPAANNHDPRTILRLAQLIGEVEPDLVQTWLTTMDVMGGIAAILARKPWIMTERNAKPPTINSLKVKLRRWLATRARMIVANSKSGIDVWKRLGRSRAQLEVVPNALLQAELRHVKKADLAAASLPVDTALVIYAGRLEAQKNIENLLEALAIVVERRNATALLFGRGPQDQMISDFIAQHELEGRIVLVGFVTDLWRWIKAADVFVSVSHFEGMPNTVMEAMALGCPLVISDTLPHREICDESQALFVDRMSPGNIADAVTNCLDHTDEARLRSAQARERAEGWSIDATACSYDAIYRRLILSSGADN
jgi:glycosyltransferase involved in cell wall biosynthesis